MVTYGDGVGDTNINELVVFHEKKKTVGTLTGVYPVSKYGIMRKDDHDVVLDFVEKPQLRDWTNGGFMAFKYNFFDYLRPWELEHPALERLIADRQLSLYTHKGF